MTSRKAAVGAALTAALSGTAHAQAYQCRVPQAVQVPQVRPDGPMRRLPVTGYTFALSWAPEFCKGREGRRADAVQCSGDNGSFGLVVHGLWPQGRSGGRSGWPQWCPTGRTPSPTEVRRNLCMMPSARMQANEWAKHGSCMVRRPETYFRVTRILWDSLTLPDLDRLSKEDGLTVGMLRDRWRFANPGWPHAAVGVKLNERGWLQELRLCYDKRFLPAPCDAARYGPKDSAPLKIWRGL